MPAELKAIEGAKKSEGGDSKKPEADEPKEPKTTENPPLSEDFDQKLKDAYNGRWPSPDTAKYYDDRYWRHQAHDHYNEQFKIDHDTDRFEEDYIEAKNGKLPLAKRKEYALDKDRSLYAYEKIEEPFSLGQ